MALDVYLDYQCYLKEKHYYSSYLSFFRQKQHIDETWFREKNDPLYHYSSSTQRNWKELGKREGDYEWIHENVENLVDNIDDVLINNEIEMKKITFNKKRFNIMKVIFVNWTLPYFHRENSIGYRKIVSNTETPSEKYDMEDYEILIQKVA